MVGGVFKEKGEIERKEEVVRGSCELSLNVTPQGFQGDQMAPITPQSCSFRLSKGVRMSVKDKPERNEEREAETDDENT